MDPQLSFLLDFLASCVCPRPSAPHLGGSFALQRCKARSTGHTVDCACVLCCVLAVARSVAPLTSNMKEKTWRLQELCQRAPCHMANGRLRKAGGSEMCSKDGKPAAQQKNDTSAPRCASAKVQQELLGRSPMTVTSSSSVSGVPNSCSYGSAPRGISDLELLEQLPVGGAGSDFNSAPVPSCFFLLLLSLQPFSFFLHSHVLELLHHFCLSPLYPPIFLFEPFQFWVSG